MDVGERKTWAVGSELSAGLGREGEEVGGFTLDNGFIDFVAEWRTVGPATNEFNLDKSSAANTEFDGFEILKKDLLLTLVLDAPNLNASAVSTPSPGPRSQHPQIYVAE